MWEALLALHICIAHAKFLRGQVPERAVRAHPVVIQSPVFNGLPRIVEGEEPVLVQALLAEFAVERFDIAVLHRTTRGDEMQRDFVLVCPLIQRLRGKLRSVIDDDPLRQPALQPQPFQHTNHAQRRQRGVHLDDGHLSRVRILDRQRAELTPARQRIVQEIHRPCLVRPRGRRQQHPCLRTDPPPAPPSPHHQLLLHIDPVHPLDVHLPAFPFEQNVQPPVSPAPPLLSQFTQAHAQLLVDHCEPRWPRLIAHHRTHNLHPPTGTPLRAPRSFAKHPHGFPFRLWAYHFFESTALNPTISSACSATSCFSLRFSSSSCRSRCASLTSSPPYFAFQR